MSIMRMSANYPFFCTDVSQKNINPLAVHVYNTKIYIFQSCDEYVTFVFDPFAMPCQFSWQWMICDMDAI